MTALAWPLANPLPAFATAGNETLAFTTDISDPFEIFFQLAQEEARRGHYPSSAKLFEALLKTNPTPRIQLELARVLFLDRRFEASKTHFTELYERDEIPWAVKENIRLYLDAIDDALGSVRLNFSLVSDSNPRRFTESRQVRIYGQVFTVIPPSDNKEIRGLRSSLYLARDLSGEGTFTGYLNTTYTDFEQSQFDRWVTDLGVLFSPRCLPKLKWRAGLEESFYGGDHLYEFPYVALLFVPQPVHQFRFRSELKVGELRVPKSDLFDATNWSLTTTAYHPVPENTSLQWELYLEKSIADEKFVSYYGGAVGLELGTRVFRHWEMHPFVSVSRRVYESVDLLFAQTRSDVKSIFGLRVKNQNMKVAGFVPELVLQYDENRSNIAFYSYDKLFLSLNWSSPTF